MSNKEIKKSVLPIEKVLTLNNLTYNSVGDITPIQSRVLRKFYPETNSYNAGQTMNWNLDVGSSFVAGSTSFLTFDVEATITGGTAGETVGLAHKDSAMNLFAQSTIMKNEIIEDVEHCNMLAWHQTLNEKTHEHLWYGPGSVEGYSSGTLDLVGGKTKFVVPLSRFLGFFANQSDLIPGQLLSGCRLKLTLADINEALHNFVVADDSDGTGDHTYSYKVTDPVISLDLFNLTDEARLAVKKLSARKNGLTYNFTTYAAHTVPMVGSHVQSQVGMSVSHCLEAFSVSQTLANKTDITKKSMQSDVYSDNMKFRYILGSVSFPEAPITSKEEAFIASQQMWSGSISEKYQRNSISIIEFNARLGCMAQSFERSHLQAISGLSLSGNRVLQLDVSETGNSTTKQITTFMKYVRTVSSYMDGKVVIRY